MTQTKYPLNGKEINLTSDNTTIKSNNFNVDKNGKVTCSNMNVTGGNIELSNASYSSPKFTTSGKGMCGFDGDTVIYPDGLRTRVNGNTYINLSIGENGWNGSPSGGLTVSDNENDTYINPYGIETPELTQTSKESKKKNIEKYNENAIEIVNNSEIHMYNFKFEADENKKHIGFVIGDEGGNYKTPKQVISSSGEGIDSYTMCSILWKAVQELNEKVEKQDKLIKLLLEKLNIREEDTNARNRIFKTKIS